MIDIHCHILPAVDDGAKTMEDALQMARMAASSGVKTILATPHCNLPHAARKNYVTIELRDQFVALCKAVKQAGIPLSILPGAEILCTPDLPELLQQKKLLTLAGSNYLLVEFLFDESIRYMEEMFSIITARGLIPVIAHPERYEAVQRDPTVIGRWFETGYIIQLNKGSILGFLGRRAESTAHWVLQHGLAHVVASDAHSPDVRTTQMRTLRTQLEEAYSPQYAAVLLTRNPQRILSNLPVIHAQ